MGILKKTLLLVVVLLAIHASAIAEKRAEIQDIAFGLRDGNVILLNINTLSVKTFKTKEIPNSFVVGIASFRECNKLVFDVFGTGQTGDREVGIINLNNGQVSYWDVSKIDLGKKIVDVALSRTDPAIVIGKFADRYSYQVPESAYKEFERTINIGLFNVCNDSWTPQSKQVQQNVKTFPGKIDHPLLRKKIKSIYDKLKATQLISKEETRDALIWGDENYIVFRSGGNLVIGRIEGDEIIISKSIDVKKTKLNANILHPTSAVFVYSKD
jgi:hypothetical protein